MSLSPSLSQPLLRWLFLLLGMHVILASAIAAAPTIDPSSPRVFVDPRTPPTFAVVATGTDLTFQWYEGNPYDTARPISGATSNTYSPPTTNRALESFWGRVFSAGGAANSQAYSTPAPTPTSTLVARGVHNRTLMINL